MAAALAGRKEMAIRAERGQVLRKMDKSVAAFGSKQRNLWNVHPR